MDLSYHDILVRGHQALALVEFTSDQPIRVMTTVNFTMLSCVSIGVDDPAYRGGHCDGIGGPILDGFTEYLQPGQPVQLLWLTPERFNFRDNIFFNNPNEGTLTATVVFRSSNGVTTLTRSYEVPPRSTGIAADVFQDRAFNDLLLANGQNQVITATVTGDRPFYVFAAVRSKSTRPDDNGRLVIVQPVRQ